MFKYLVLENILTNKECQQIIEIYDPLLNNTNNTNHIKYDCRNIKLSEILFERIKKYVPNNICEISDHWCISKCLANYGSTVEHFDGNVLYDNKISQYTILIYLNDDFMGGNTIISHPYCKEKIKIKPKTGSILLLDQDIIHYSEKHHDNVKYIIKSDLMIKID